MQPIETIILKEYINGKEHVLFTDIWYHFDFLIRDGYFDQRLRQRLTSNFTELWSKVLKKYEKFIIYRQSADCFNQVWFETFTVFFRMLFEYNIFQIIRNKNILTEYKLSLKWIKNKKK